MPCLSQGCYHLQQQCYQVRVNERMSNCWVWLLRFSYDVADSYLAHDGLLAGAAASLLSSVDSLAAHVGLKITEHRIQLILFKRLALSRLIEMSRMGLADVDAGLRALAGQWALRALGGLIGLRVRGVGYCLMLMGTAVDLQWHVDCRVEWKFRYPLSEKSRLMSKFLVYKKIK